MRTLNRDAADVLRALAPNAVTDVTGFGLPGHAHEMAERSGVRIVLDAGRLPALDGALDAARAGVTTAGTRNNREYASIGHERGRTRAHRARLRPADRGRPARVDPPTKGCRSRHSSPPRGSSSRASGASRRAPGYSSRSARKARRYSARRWTSAPSRFRAAGFLALGDAVRRLVLANAVALVLIVATGATVGLPGRGSGASTGRAARRTTSNRRADTATSSSGTA